MSALSNTPQRGVYNYTRVADTSHWAMPCAAISSFELLSLDYFTDEFYTLVVVFNSFMR